MNELLERVLTAPAPPEHASLAQWWAAHRAATRGLPTIARAILGGAAADRLGWAFAAGYGAALRALVPAELLGEDEIGALAATEERGAHPKGILTELRDGTLHGRKRWVTMAPEAHWLFVVAREPRANDGEGERPLLRVVRVCRTAPGVTVTPLPPTPFVAEIPHAEITLDGVAVGPSDVLPGDGYDRYLKPFRTIEDIHVHAAALAWLGGVARRHGFSDPLVARAAGILAALHALGASDPSAPATHVALAGTLAATESLLSDLAPEWSRAPGEMRARWEADRALFGVAAKARAQRSARAFERLSSFIGRPSV